MTISRRSIHDLVYGRQYNRILRLSFPNNDAPASQFVVNKIDARESLSMDFEFTIELLSDEASVALKEMQGNLLSIELVRKDGSLRYFSGYVFSFRRCHSDGGFTVYAAKLGPWLRFLRNCLKTPRQHKYDVRMVLFERNLPCGQQSNEHGTRDG